VPELRERARLRRDDLDALAACGALSSIAGHRHRAAWEVAGAELPLPLMPVVRIAEGIPLLRTPTEGENIVADYASLGLTLGRHPLALLRAELRREQVVSATQLWERPHDGRAQVAGLVITRQRPGSASGVIFVTLEDETGHINLIVWERVAVRHRRALLEATLLGAWGRVQREGDVLHLVVDRLEDRSQLLDGLRQASRDFC
jgi:error-prone DNA polymerase